MYRLIIHSGLVPFKLSRQVDGGSFTVQCVLVHDGNNWAMLRSNDSSNSADRDVVELVVVNALDIHLLVCFLNDTDISTSNYNICTMINQSLLNICMTLALLNTIHVVGIISFALNMINSLPAG